jgi:hypothetical protein
LCYTSTMTQHLLAVLAALVLATVCACADDDEPVGEAGLSHACMGHADCGEHLFCTQQSEFAGLCVAPCEVDDDCETIFGVLSNCVDWAGFCSIRCGADSECPSGHCDVREQYCHNGSR